MPVLGMLPTLPALTCVAVWRRASTLTCVGLQSRAMKAQIITTLGRCIDKDPEEIEEDLNRPLYLSPYEAVKYGAIDKVLEAKADIDKAMQRP